MATNLKPYTMKFTVDSHLVVLMSKDRAYTSP